MGSLVSLSAGMSISDIDILFPVIPEYETTTGDAAIQAERPWRLGQEMTTFTRQRDPDAMAALVAWQRTRSC